MEYGCITKKALEKVQTIYDSLISSNIKTKDKFSINRSFRWVVATRTKYKEVSMEDIYIYGSTHTRTIAKYVQAPPYRYWNPYLYGYFFDTIRV